MFDYFLSTRNGSCPSDAGRGLASLAEPMAMHLCVVWGWCMKEKHIFSVVLVRMVVFVVFVVFGMVACKYPNNSKCLSAGSLLLEEKVFVVTNVHVADSKLATRNCMKIVHQSLEQYQI